MANKKIFASANHVTKRAPLLDTPLTLNAAGSLAYSQAAYDELVQLVVTGNFRDSFYTSASSQLARMKNLLSMVSTEFVAKLAIYARRQAFQKDTPAYLVAYLAKNDAVMFERVFFEVIDDGKMLKNFVQMVRSGVTGKKSLGSQAKRLVVRWIQEAPVKRLLSASIGNAPSLADVIRLAHPRPADDEQRAFYGWLLGRDDVNEEVLPVAVRSLVRFRRNPHASNELPDVPFLLLTSLELGVDGWAQVAKRATWQQLRANLNTFIRHGVFDKYPALLDDVCARLANAKAIEESRVTPHQLLAAVLFLDAQGSSTVHKALSEALFNAIELACGNVPTWEGKSVAVLLDVSLSMKAPVTGSSGDANTNSKISCSQAGALFTAVMARRNIDCTVITFDNFAHVVNMGKGRSMKAIYDSIPFTGGGTDCGKPVELMIRHGVKADYVVMLSDNESHGAWTGNNRYGRTNLASAWLEYKKTMPHAKMVCIDFCANSTVQVPNMHDVMNVGGFTDDVFRVADRFFTTGVRTMESVKKQLTLAADIEKMAVPELV